MKSERLLLMYEQTRKGFYRKYRRPGITDDEIRRKTQHMTPYQTAVREFQIRLDSEEPIIIPGDRFFFTRSRDGKCFAVQPGSRIANITADWELLIEQGLSGRINAAEQKLSDKDLSEESRDYLISTIEILNHVIAFSERYADAAEAGGDSVGAEMLRRVPKYPAKTFREALQSIFFMFSMLHIAAVTQLGLGRLDQVLNECYTRDLAEGRITREEAGELLAEFFLMLNRDADLYGIEQQGDDGESLMLGGCRRDGSSGINDLTLLFLECAYDVAMINPKINLRINSDTPDEILKAGIRLTGRGLGFPQYSNDEVVIPALVKFGYPLEDARDYTVAACWEFIVKDGCDIPNRMLMNLALAVDRAIRKALREGLSFDALLAGIKPEMRKLLPEMPLKVHNQPNPLFSALSGKCIERGRDLNFGGGSHYYFGALSCGSSTAADSLMAVKKYVYDEKRISAAELLDALENNFKGSEALQKLLKNAPKVGDNTPETNELLNLVYETYADVIEGVHNSGYGDGRIRPGTGSAMGYAWFTQKESENRLRATADGRRDGEYLSANLSPAPGVRAPGILSILQVYGKLNYNRLCNGGPITMEFAPAYFRNEEAVAKTILFLRAFVKAGCQQLQLNVLDRELLLDAQKHPELHRDLIVRVWGWSGYFVELDKIYQDQIIERTAYGA